MLSSLLAGIVMGLTAGFSPGPLSTLVITQTLRHGLKEGVKVAVAPLMTDLPIIAASLLLLSRAAHNENILGVISLTSLPHQQSLMQTGCDPSAGLIY